MHRHQATLTARILLLLAGLLFSATGWALNEEDILRPEQAFIISGSSDAPDRVKVQWKIAEGYYLYRDKFKFWTDTPGLEPGEPDLPTAQIKHEEVFGDVAIYRDRVVVEVPVQRAEGAPDMLTLNARSQGCADAGLCFPPHTQTVLVALSPKADGPMPVDPARVENLSPVGTGSTSESAEPAAEAAPAGDALQGLSQLGDSLGLDEEDGILEPEQAFRFDAEVIDGRTLRVYWQIAEGTYLYEDKLKVDIAGDGVTTGDYAKPEPKIKHDTVRPDGEIGDVAVYVGDISFDIPLLRSGTDATSIELTASYQGCAERGICYPPQKSQQTLNLPAVDAADATPAPAVTSAQPQAPPVDSSGPVSEQDRIAAMLAGGNTLIIIGSFFLIGLLLAFTPCVFPMIPILSGIIAGQGSQITTRKAFVLSLTYVLAMSVTYTAAGVAAALAGENLQVAFQNPWVLSIFAGVFVALSLSMFGFYELQLPSSLQSRLAEISNKQEGGTLAGVAIMGLLSALIVGPCVAPPLAGALIYIGQTGDALLGGLALFAMSLGMGAPLIAIGTSAGKLLPRAGGWMDAVKGVFGVLMLGVAIYLLERVVSESVAMVLWGLLLLVSAVYMGALTQLPVEATGWKKLWKGLGVALLVYGALMLVGAAAGGKDTLQPLRGLAVTGGTGGGEQAHLNFRRIKSVDDLQRELASARAAGRPVMLDFYADWCIYCKQMEKNTFPDPAVQGALADFVLLQADVTANDEADKALQSHVGIPAPPAMIFWDGRGQERRNYRLLGYKGPAEFARHVQDAVN